MTVKPELFSYLIMDALLWKYQVLLIWQAVYVVVDQIGKRTAWEFAAALIRELS